MAGPVKSVADKAAGSFMDTLKGIGTDKVVSEALLGGAAGIGLNLGANVVTGDSGGYTGAAMLGGAAGGLGRAGLKHFNLETQASNLFSTAKGVATGSMTKAQKTMGTKNNKPVGERIMYGKHEASINGYDDSIRAEKAIEKKFLDQGKPTLAREANSRAGALGARQNELFKESYDMMSKTRTPHQLEEFYGDRGGSRFIKDNIDPNFRSTADRVSENTAAVRSMQTKTAQRHSQAATAQGPGFDQRQLDRIDARSGYSGNTKDARRAARQAKNTTTNPQVSWSNGSNQTINMGSMASSATQAPAKPNYKPQQSFGSNLPGMASAGATTTPNNFNNINNSGLSQSSMAGLARLQNKDYGPATF